MLLHTLIRARPPSISADDDIAVAPIAFPPLRTPPRNTCTQLASDERAVSRFLFYYQRLVVLELGKKPRILAIIECEYRFGTVASCFSEESLWPRIIHFRMAALFGLRALNKALLKVKLLLTRSISACFRHPVTHASKILVPRLREAGDDLFRGLPRDLHSGMHNISPRVHPRAFSRMFFEADPLRQHHPERVVDPSHFVRGLAIRDHVAHNRLHRLRYFDLQPAARFPGLSFAPFHLAIDICEFIPAPPVRENFPGESPAGFGRHTILKSKHNFPSCTPVFPFVLGFPNEGRSGPIIYTLYL